MAPSISNDITTTALSFRGYNVTNLGRTTELLSEKAYRKIVIEELERFSTVCDGFSDTSVDLVKRVEQNDEPGLKHYAESIALIVAVEVAQMRLLNEIHQVETSRAQVALGYSLGELTAISFAGIFAIDELIRVPLAMAADSLELAHDTRMGVLFSRGPTIDETDVERLCLQITSENNGTIGISAVLSPNTYLLIGQQETVVRFKAAMHDLLPTRAHLRINNKRWPPLHTPIVRQKSITDRASVMLETLSGGFSPPAPPVLSLATGKMSYDDHSARDVIRKWVDHPQRLWDVVDETLDLGVETILHIGPEPNVIPATFNRLSKNVIEQTSGGSLGSLGMRAVSGLARRPWLAALLPARATLLRAPHIKHVIVEDWLIENAPT
ncbi:MAG: ACP S-malonyltransferase [Planctomycetes bacterium]|nr:ACP S-malonyltransferase [Planctomycetota bacterium]